MDFLTKNTGLQHIAENIFLNLGYSDLVNCAEVSKNWKKIMEIPTIWFQKCQQSPKFFNRLAWKKLIQLTNRSDYLKEELTSHLRYLSLNLSYAKFMAEEEFCPIFWLIRNCGRGPSLDSVCANYIKTLAPLIEKNKSDGEILYRSIYKAAEKGFINIIKVLAPVGKKQNVLGPIRRRWKYCETPIHAAARKGYVEVVKILAPLMDIKQQWLNRNRKCHRCTCSHTFRRTIL